MNCRQLVASRHAPRHIDYRAIVDEMDSTAGMVGPGGVVRGAGGTSTK